MPIRMAWVDEKTKAIVKEDGFHSMPCVAHRFYKRPQIVYGYSPAMNALLAMSKGKIVVGGNRFSAERGHIYLASPTVVHAIRQAEKAASTDINGDIANRLQADEIKELVFE